MKQEDPESSGGVNRKMLLTLLAALVGFAAVILGLWIANAVYPRVTEWITPEQNDFTTRGQLVHAFFIQTTSLCIFFFALGWGFSRQRPRRAWKLGILIANPIVVLAGTLYYRFSLLDYTQPAYQIDNMRILIWVLLLPGITSLGIRQTPGKLQPRL